MRTIQVIRNGDNETVHLVLDKITGFSRGLNPSVDEVCIGLVGEGFIVIVETLEAFIERYERAMDQLELDEHNRMVQRQLKEAGV